jgi:hypothetical protein
MSPLRKGRRSAANARFAYGTTLRRNGKKQFDLDLIHLGGPNE